MFVIKSHFQFILFILLSISIRWAKTLSICYKYHNRFWLISVKIISNVFFGSAPTEICHQLIRPWLTFSGSSKKMHEGAFCWLFWIGPANNRGGNIFILRSDTKCRFVFPSPLNVLSYLSHNISGHSCFVWVSHYTGRVTLYKSNFAPSLSL